MYLTSLLIKNFNLYNYVFTAIISAFNFIESLFYIIMNLLFISFYMGIWISIFASTLFIIFGVGYKIIDFLIIKSKYIKENYIYFINTFKNREKNE